MTLRERGIRNGGQGNGLRDHGLRRGGTSNDTLGRHNATNAFDRPAS